MLRLSNAEAKTESLTNEAKPTPGGTLDKEGPRSRGDHDRGSERNGEKVSPVAYLRGCVWTACWWCQKQPPIPIAAEIIIAIARKTRMSVPQSLLELPHNTRLALRVL